MTEFATIVLAYFAGGFVGVVGTVIYNWTKVKEESAHVDCDD